MSTIKSVPKKLLKNSILIRKIRVDPSLVFHIIIDKHGKLFEICDGSVKNVCVLPKFDSKSISQEKIDIQLYFTYQNSQRKVFYLIRNNENLHVILRENSTLKLFKSFEHVKDIYIRDSDSSKTGHALVEIEFKDEMSLIVTDFSEDRDTSYSDIVFEEQSFDNVLKRAQEMAHESRSKCQETADSYAKLYQNACDELKLTPRHLRSENQLEKVVLVPYANNWIKIHNGHLVLGLPILNVTYQR